jgi:glycosyltransferase involved in cell wall biosynthesis
LFHFNSSVTETVYRHYLTDIKGKVVPISNSNIGDNRERGFCDGKTLKIVFIGHTDILKGFPLLRSVLLELQQYDWQLDVWGGHEGIDPDSNKIVYRGRYTASDLEEIYKNTSLVIVPSQWYETFSFVTLEALSYGVPLLVSNKVGAKSIVANYDSSFIFNTKKELKDKLEMIMQNRSDLVSYHNRILSLPWNHSMEEHSNEIGKEVYGKSF